MYYAHHAAVVDHRHEDQEGSDMARSKPQELDSKPDFANHPYLKYIRTCKDEYYTLNKNRSTYLLLVTGLPSTASVELFSSMLLDEADATADASSPASLTMRLRKRIGNKVKVYGKQASK